MGFGAQKLRAAPYGTSMSEPDDDYDEWPPTAHPWRELFTASLFVLVIGAFVVWIVWAFVAWVL